MPWAATSLNRITTTLDLSFQRDVQLIIQSAMDRVEEQSGDGAISIIEGWLDEVDALDDALIADRANGGLIQADVLRWEGNGGKLQGLRDERSRYVQRIANALSLKASGIALGGGGRGRLIRS
jgi:hypothetical protein